MLQDYFVDNLNGQAMSGGVITCYRDNSRTTLKNWYYQTGAPGAYTYIPLPNPLTLSDVGTIQDNNRNDVIPFFYPYDENDPNTPQAYYVKVENQDGQLQFTRANFPFNPTTAAPTVENSTNKNLILNGEFWRNVGSVHATTLEEKIAINGVDMYYITLAPSQHEGMPIMRDIQFYKNANGAVDNITFGNFVDDFNPQIIPDDITPEYYLNFQCSGIGGETQKYIQFPVQLHVDSLSEVNSCVVTLPAMAITGSPEITIGIYQYLGDGVASPLVSIIQTIKLTNAWDKYKTIPFTIPSAEGANLGTGGDDALYLQIGLPVAGDGICNINIAKPGFYLSETPPTNDFQTYDEINARISSPRTMDLRLSLNDYEFGWVPMNDGTIGTPDSKATTRPNYDTWPLYNLLWKKFKPYNSGSINPLAQMVDSAGVNTSYGTTAIGDFNLNKALTLTKTMGKVLLGTVPIENLLAAYATTFTASNVSGNLLLTADNAMSLFNGMPIQFEAGASNLPDNLLENTIYYVAAFNGTTQFYVATSFVNAMAANATLPGNVVASGADLGTAPNTVTSAITGTFEGEYAHTQVIPELAAHGHNLQMQQITSGIGPGGADSAVGGANGNIYAANIKTTGNSTPFNVTQPGVFSNIFIKL